MRVKTAEPPDARTFLRSIILFEGLEQPAIEQVLAAMEWLVIGGGETLMRAGEPGDGLYVVVHGRLAVVLHPPDQEELIVRELGRGATVGEMALVTGQPRAATVRALRDTQLGELSRQSFDHLIEQNPQLALRLTRVLAGWVQPHSHGRETNAPATVAVLPLPGVEGAHVLEQLARALGGAALHLDPARVDEALGEGRARAPSGSPHEAELAAWLNAQELSHRLVLYQADPDLASPWSRRCIRQADRLLVVASAEVRASAREVAAALAAVDQLGGRVPQELVLVHGSGADPRGTDEWRRRATFARHHHVQDRRPADWARLGRHLSGKTLGLVLGGGGARGFAHIGVLRALSEAGVEVDLVGGTSMGALIAAQCACGFDARTIVEQNRRLWLEINPLKELTVPVVSLLGGQRAVTGLKELFGERQIEDLPLDYYCVSTNLTRSEAVVHRFGPLWRAVMASIAIPGIAPPVIEGGDLLVDGAVLNILPTDVMRAADAGTIVAVDVSPLLDFSVDARHLSSPSPTRFLGDRLNPFRERKFPSIFHIVERAAMLASGHISKAERRLSEILYIDPPVGQYDTFGMKSLVEIEAVGYRAAVEKIEAWSKDDPSGLATKLTAQVRRTGVM